jgi:hypothetical protein
MANDTSSTSKFPAPYVNSVSEEESYVVKVDQNKGEIGSRSSGMPKTMLTEKLGIEHVGGTI